MNRQAVFVSLFVAGMFIALIGPYFPAILMPVGFVYLGFYLCFPAAIGWSAIRHRSQGWKSGLLLAGLLASIPFWVMVGIYFYQLYIATT